MSDLPPGIGSRPSNRKGWRTRPHPTMERFVAVAAYLMQGPWSCRDLAVRLGIHYGGNGLVTLLDLMREKGVVHVAGWTRTGPRQASKLVPVYAWQPAPFTLADAPKPVRKRSRRKGPNDAPALT